jgi:uncharacterized membrane protein
MLWMAAFHFAFDLNHFGLLQPRQNFYGDSFWTLQRTCIVSLFLFCAGLGQAYAQQRELGATGSAWLGSARFWRRWGQIAVCALLVSAGSALMFPQSWIFFGVLHGVAVMLLLLRLLAPWHKALWPLAALCLVLPHVARGPLFDQPWLQWLGLMSKRPITEDYVPLLPWLGVMLLGLALGQALLQRGRALPRLPAALKPLARLGRWPLSFYMLHQPLLIGAILLFMQLRRS